VDRPSVSSAPSGDTRQFALSDEQEYGGDGEARGHEARHPLRWNVDRGGCRRPGGERGRYES
jgi:hypothetical protein